MSKQYFSFTCLISLLTYSVFTSCNKKDSDIPNTQDSTSTLACRPVQEMNTTDHSRTHTYQYDAQKRVVKYTDVVFTGNRNVDVPTEITYEGNDIVLKSASSAGSATVSTIRYVRGGGKFLYHVTTSVNFPWSDTTYYSYLGDKLIRRRLRYHDYAGGGNYTDSIAYDIASALPSRIVSTDIDSLGTKRSSLSKAITYDSKEVAYSPFSSFLIAPGIETVKVGRMIKQIVVTDALRAGETSTTTYQTIYDAKGNASQVHVSGTGSGSAFDYVAEFTYLCD